jgi:hypothetical protein
MDVEVIRKHNFQVNTDLYNLYIPEREVLAEKTSTLPFHPEEDTEIWRDF